jgi:hypothetical protein
LSFFKRNLSFRTECAGSHLKIQRAARKGLWRLVYDLHGGVLNRLAQQLDAARKSDDALAFLKLNVPVNPNSA